MSTVRLTVTARATDSNLCYAHIKLMQQKAHIELMLLAFKGHSRPSTAVAAPSSRAGGLRNFTASFQEADVGATNTLWFQMDKTRRN